MNIREYISKQTVPFSLIFGLALVISLGVIDKITGPEISFSIFYLLPIIFVTWLSNKWIGILISIASAITWLLADLMSGQTYSHWLIPYWNAFMRLGFFMIIIYILLRLKSALELEKMFSRIDSLTGVANGRYFFELANGENIRSSTYNHPFTIAYMDLDNFKTVNDRFGHNEGDIVLCTVANIIQSNIRPTDIVGRLGGDEFAILLPEIGAVQSQVVIRKIHKGLLDTILENKWPITISIGVGTFIGSQLNVDEIIRMTESLMYSVKEGGKNRIKYEVFGN